MKASASGEHVSERAPLVDLAERVGRAAADALGRAVKQHQRGAWEKPIGQGFADVTFQLDEATEKAVEGWLDQQAKLGPLSLFTEDRGWRHRGPGPQGEPHGLQGFDHGGPRIIVDPVDGTRHLMFDLRPAWCVIGQAGPGPHQPQLAELEHGILAELPDTRSACARRLAASKGTGAVIWTVDSTGNASQPRPLQTDEDDRVDHGYFPFYSYHPDIRAATQTLAGRFFSLLEQEEKASIAHCYDDQYIASGGQLALVALGAYRMVCDPRPLLAARRDKPTQTAKPYDLAGAVLVAREAGAVVTDLNGRQLDTPLDGQSEVGFCAFHNAASAKRLWPHLARAIHEDSH